MNTIKNVSIGFIFTVGGFFAGQYYSKFVSLDSLATASCKSYSNADTGIINFKAAEILVFCHDSSSNTLR